jgi:hypothetical protein
VWTNPERAFKTADDTTNGTAYNSANRSRSVISNIGTVGNSVGNTLRVDGQRRTERHERGGGKQQPVLHDKSPHCLGRRVH